MKFNEKLIELRKREGLSQEELGYKIDVTRQTGSKWELGETTPEMAKLIELSKMFNVSVDELINDSEITTNVNPIIEDKPIQDKKPRNNKVLIIIVTLLVVVIVGIIGKVATSFIATNKFDENTNQGVEEAAKGFFERIFSLLNKALDNQEEVLENLDKSDEDFENIKENMEDIFIDTTNKINTSGFNGALELYAGSGNGMTATNVLDKIITSNKTQGRIITVQYNGAETQDENEIKNIKRNFDTFDECEITYEYDANGYINKVIIEKL